MNKKYDYIQLLCDLDSQQYRLYNICSTNFRFFSNMIYNNIVHGDDTNETIFNREYFIEWLNDNVSDEDVTRLDSEVIKWIHDYPEFFDFYKGDWSVDSIINSVIQSWKNKPKTKRVNKLGMLYSNYVRFLGTQNGQSFLYGTTAYDLMEQVPDESLPFYEQAEYKYQQLNKCKKLIIGEVAKNGREACEAKALWDAIFKDTEKFTITKALNILKNDPKAYRYSDMQMRRHLKKMQIKIITGLLKGDRIETYFDADYMIEIDGNRFALRGALEYYLITLKDQFDDEFKTHKNKYVNGHANVAAYTRDEMREVIDSFCKANGISYSFDTGYFRSIAKLRADCDLRSHKTFKMWIYEGGGYRDFYSGTTGYITDIIPQEFFSKVW